METPGLCRMLDSEPCLRKYKGDRFLAKILPYPSSIAGFGGQGSNGCGCQTGTYQMACSRKWKQGPKPAAPILVVSFCPLRHLGQVGARAGGGGFRV